MRAINRLTATKIDSLDTRGKYADGGGLYLYVARGGSKSWVYRWKVRGRRREAGLGGYPTVSLAKARQRARHARELISDGIDPILERKKASAPTFRACAQMFLETMERQWRNHKHRNQWHMTLETYCKPIEHLCVSDIKTDQVLLVLKPIWETKSETASRLRGRIERVLDYAAVNGWREGPNPALWRGHLKNVLPAKKKLVRGHHPAIAYENLPGFFDELRDQLGNASAALKFLILTTSRTGEVLSARWSEFDLENYIWTVPAERMKAGKMHRVPLCGTADLILKDLDRSSEYVFAGQSANRPLSNMAMAQLLKRMGYKDITVHGMRSAFRDWAADKTDHPREVAEAALAHTIGDAVERAYRRGDGLERRRQLMADWEAYLVNSSR